MTPNTMVAMIFVLLSFLLSCCVVSAGDSSLSVPASDSSSGHDEAISKFVNSFSQLCAQSSQSNLFSTAEVEIRPSPLGGYGVFAKKSFQQGESVFRVARDVVIAHESIWLHEGLASIRPLVDSNELFNSSAFALWLYEEAQRSQSPWHHYFATLPQVFHNAYYVNEQDFSVLEQLLPAATQTGAAVRQVLLEPKSILISQYAIIKDKIYQGKDSAHKFLAKLPSFEEFRRFLCVVLTRSWAVDGRYILAPFIDFFNHESSALPPVFSPTDVNIYVNRNVSAGEEIFVSYGQKSDFDLLLLYGFVPDVNVFNGYSFHVSANPLYPQLLQEHHLDTQQKILYDGSLSFSTINLFRILQLNAEESALHEQINSGALISWRNEREALKSMLVLFKSFLNEMSTTIETDEYNLKRVLSGELRLSWFSISLLRHFLKQKLLLTNAINTIGNYWLALLQA